MRSRLFLLSAAAACVASLLASPADAAGSTARVMRWSSTAELSTGYASRLVVADGSMRVGANPKTTTYVDPYGSKTRRTFEYGYWDSPWVDPGFDLTRLVPSWNVDAPSGTWIRVQIRAKKGSTTGSWDTVANWGYGTAGVHRTSSSSQTDDLTSVDVDTVKARSGTLDAWQMRVLLLRPVGSTSTPVVHSLSGIASAYATRTRSTSPTTMTATRVLGVPRYSQMTHRGEYPQWGGGGEAWCSPTSTSMVLRYFGSGPKSADYAWSPYSASWVDHAARYTFDHRYDGTGNWPFNTAYAGRYGLDAFVTRFYDLRDAEAFIKAGIPVVASIAFRKGELDGAPISSTPGHLLVIVGFTSSGRVVVNDPAGKSTTAVRREYSRGQFERAWLGGSGGIVYVMRPTSKALPPDTSRW
ncbi:C39 family peptidase [Aeromicrobium terrae]|uniref:Peptidase C39 family protein n=1 Tax=Aeromicrobium terrae TaxID=2498846 RepID=A0A5C8NLU8_9ACTN|nr:C39 family peptidase [Aeromicrobium terrae]TXL62242.1 peptidase C39 family protein [Aeromicrobium terrae]